MNRAERHLLIEEIINTQTIRKQSELLKRLQEQDVRITQATISRDIRQLKIVKVIDDTGQPRFVLFQEGQTFEEEEHEAHLIQKISEVVVHVERVRFLTIIHTIPNNATLLASIIDETVLFNSCCSLAGFDTIVIVSPSEAEADQLASYFNKYLPR